MGYRKRIMRDIRRIKPQSYQYEPSMSRSYHSLTASVDETKSNVSRTNSSAPSAATSIVPTRPIFRDSIIKGAICTCYGVFLLSYICNPLLNHGTYYGMLSIMYPGYNSTRPDDTSVFFYDTIEVFLRTFVGMTLTSVFFTFVTELTDKQLTTTYYNKLWRLIKHDMNKCWAVILILMVLSLSLEVFTLRDDIQNQLHHYFPNDSIFHSLVDCIINSSWIGINLVGFFIIVCKLFTELSSVYTKTKALHESHYAFIQLSHRTPIVAFTLELLTLLALYFVYILFLILYIVDQDHAHDSRQWDIYRQGTIWLLALGQFWTLIRVKQAQKYPNAQYLARFESPTRVTLLLHGYFKWNCILIVYNVIYIFMFKVQYFGAKSFDSQHLYQNIGFAFSFSLSSSKLFLLTHFIAAYQKWMDDKAYKQNLIEESDYEVDSPRKPNPGLDKYMKLEKSSRSKPLIRVSNVLNTPQSLDAVIMSD